MTHHDDKTILLLQAQLTKTRIAKTDTKTQNPKLQWNTNMIEHLTMKFTKQWREKLQTHCESRLMHGHWQAEGRRHRHASNNRRNTYEPFAFHNDMQQTQPYLNAHVAVMHTWLPMMIKYKMILLLQAQLTKTRLAKTDANKRRIQNYNGTQICKHLTMNFTKQCGAKLQTHCKSRWMHGHWQAEDRRNWHASNNRRNTCAWAAWKTVQPLIEHTNSFNRFWTSFSNPHMPMLKNAAQEWNRLLLINPMQPYKDTNTDNHTPADACKQHYNTLELKNPCPPKNHYNSLLKWT